MSTLTIARVNALPVPPVADTLYLVKKTDTLFDLYVTSSDGTTTRHIATQEETLAQAVLFSDTPPALPQKSPLWWNTLEGELYIQYNDGDGVHWVQASPGPQIPEFGGTGTSNLMARADHNHDATYVSIGDHQW